MRTHYSVTALLTVILLAACGGAPTQEAKATDFRKRLESADLALREARLNEAEILYRQLSQSHPQLPDVWLNLGNIYSRQSQLEAAMRAYKQGLRYAANDGRLWYNLSLVELKQSVRTLETASAMLPANSPYLANIEQLHRALLSSTHASDNDPPQGSVP